VDKGKSRKQDFSKKLHNLFLRSKVWLAKQKKPGKARKKQKRRNNQSVSGPAGGKFFSRQKTVDREANEGGDQEDSRVPKSKELSSD